MQKQEGKMSVGAVGGAGGAAASGGGAGAAASGATPSVGGASVAQGASGGAIGGSGEAGGGGPEVGKAGDSKHAINININSRDLSKEIKSCPSSSGQILSDFKYLFINGLYELTFITNYLNSVKINTGNF